MRKISHINLGQFLLEQEDYVAKRKCFVFGNILPDCVPTFIYVKHNIDKTLSKVKKLIEQLLRLNPTTYRFWIKLGCIIHYVADYFTYPHTKLFHDGFWKHNYYEKRLKERLQKYLYNLTNLHTEEILKPEEIINYIEEEQKMYFLEKQQFENDVDFDIDYIATVCYNIFNAICNAKIVLN